jgi:hypothetical protein
MMVSTLLEDIFRGALSVAAFNSKVRARLLFTDMHNMARGISSIVTTAVVAGAIGFGAGVYVVPNEKADQFRAMANETADQIRAMVHGAFGAIYRAVYSDKTNPDFHPSESSQTKLPGETSRTEVQPDVPARSQPGDDVATPSSSPPDDKPSSAVNADPSGTVSPGILDRDVAAPSSSPPDDQPSSALNTDPSGTAPPAISDRDVAAPSGPPPEKDDQPSHALNADPAGTVPPNSSLNVESDAPAPVAPENGKKKHSAKKVKPKSSPSE